MSNEMYAELTFDQAKKEVAVYFKARLAAKEKGEFLSMAVVDQAAKLASLIFLRRVAWCQRQVMEYKIVLEMLVKDLCEAEVRENK